MVMMTWARRTAVGAMAVLPLVAWPGLEQPFSTPKLYLLVVTVIALAPCAWIAWRSRLRSRTMLNGATSIATSTPAPASTSTLLSTPVSMHVVAALWLASWTWSALLADIVSLDALMLALAGGGLAIVLMELRPEPSRLAAAHAIGATGVAIVAAMQWAGLDPFALAGWVAPLAGASPRLRIYGTLGNPNFVAALLTGAVPLTIGLIVQSQSQPQSQLQSAAATRGRLLLVPLGLAALTLQLLAIAATGSRAGALGLIAAGLTWTLSGPRTWRRRVAIACGLAAVVIIGVSTARPLRETLAGRIYIWQVVWPHAFEASWVGQGPGAFALLYPAWEREARRKPPTAAAAHYFAGPQQHAHNDYLEALVERGLAGPVTLFLVLTTWVGGGRRAFRQSGPAPGAEPLRIGAAAALVALGAVAFVDFPLARPAETALWWSCAALLGTARERSLG
jgi:putative inorganic carbon (HCO3(-)) transporter